MANPYLSKLASWPRTLCLLFLVPRLKCSPINIDESNPLISLIDPTSLLNTTAISRFRSSSLGAPVANCATLPNYPEWFQPSKKFDNGDCPKALELFFNDYTRDHEGIKYEYLASGVTPVHEIPTQRVPLKVGYGTCFVVIAMRNMFVEGELPGETPSRSAGSDVSSFTQLYQNALDVYSTCGTPEVNQPGWYPAGDLNSIGVFLWQSTSEINQRIK